MKQVTSGVTVCERGGSWSVIDFATVNVPENVQTCALRMTWKGQHPEVDRIEGEYPTGVIVPKAEMKLLNARIERSPTLPKYDITIKPKRPRGR